MPAVSARFPRKKLTEALSGALLALQGSMAYGAVCNPEVTAYSGTGAGSLSSAFNVGCVELSTQVSGNSGSYVTLDSDQSLATVNTIYLDATSYPITYRLAVGPTGVMQAGPSISYDAVGSGQPVTVQLDPSWTMSGGASISVLPNTDVVLTSLSNISGPLYLQGVYSQGTQPTLSFAGGITSLPVSLYVTGGGVVDLGNNTVSMTDIADSGTGNSSIRITSTGTAILQEISVTGQVTIDSGTILKPIPLTEGEFSIPSEFIINGTLDLSSLSFQASLLRALGGSGSILLAGHTLELSNANGDTFSGVIQGSGALQIDAGTQVLQGANTYVGNTSIASGATLAVSGAGSLGTGVVNANGVLNLLNATANVSIGSLTGAGQVTLGSQSLVITSGNTSFSGNMSGSGGLIVSGGTQTLSGQNTYTGQTVIDSGATLALSGTGSFAVPSRLLDNGTLAFVNADRTWADSISGSGGVTVSGGTAVLSAVNSYSGTTSIGANSTLSLSGLGSIVASLVSDNGEFDISSHTGAATVVGVSGAGGVYLGSNNLIISSGQGTLSGVISGQGGLELVGGNETLSGANTYSGKTTIDSGAVLTLSGSGSLSSVVTDNGVLAFANLASPYTNVIQGSGGVQVSSGAATLTAANTYTGSTVVLGGATLVVSGAGTISSGAVRDDGLLDLSRANATTTSVASISGTGGINLGSQILTVQNATGSLSGVISGLGGLHIAGGTQTLQGADNYIGATTVDAGAALVVGSGGQLASTPLQIDGTLDTRASTAGLTVPTLSGSGQVALGSQPLTLTQASGSFNGSISGQGGVTLQAGSETFGGVNTYVGGTTVQGGSLTLSNGAGLGSGLQVQAAGSATANGNVAVAGDVNNAGNLNVGASSQPAAVMSVGGSYTQAGTGTLHAVITPTTHTLLQVQGAQLNLGGQLVVQALPGVYLRQSYLLVNAPASTTLSGQFANWQVLGLTPSAYKFALTYVADPQVILTVTALTPFTPSGPATSNQGQLANLLNAVAGGSTGALFDRLSALLNAGSVATALDQIDGQLYAQTPGWLLQGTREEWAHLFDRLNLGLQADAAPREQAFAFIDASRGRLLGDGNADGMAMSSTAVTLGRQIRRGPWTLGAATGTLSLGATRNLIGDGMTASLYRIGVFAARPVAGMRLGGLLGYTGGQVGYGMAQRNASVLSLQTRLARDFVVSPSDVLTPLLSLDAQRLRLGGANESDPVLGLQVGSQGVTEISSLAALRGVHSWQWRALRGDLSASLGMRHWWHRPPASLNMSFNGIPGLSFTTWGVAPPRNMLEAAVGVHARLRKNLSAELSLQGDYGRGVRAGSIEAHLVWGF